MNQPWPLTETTPDPGAGGDGGTGDGQDRPDWLPANFTKPEDLAKSYDESRREMDRLRSQLEEERAQFSAALERIEAVQQPAPAGQDANPLLVQYQEAVDRGDAAAQLAITLALNKQIVEETVDSRFRTLEPTLNAVSKADQEMAFELAQNRVASQLGDQWEAVAPELQAWIKEHQAWLPAQASPEAYEQFIREGAAVVQGRKAAEQLAQLERDRAARLAAQTATGSGSRAVPVDTDEKQQAWNEIVNAPTGSYTDIRR